jgi:serine/threonine-protein kinase
MPDVPAGLTAALENRYRLDRELGRGGMATVYLARDLKHDRQVALKVLRPDLAAVLGRDRFLAEVRLTAKLDHPHILTLIDSGESDGLLWYVVPFIRGESLRQKLERERQLPIPDALAITKQIAAALDYAHRNGVIHRDLKPENILLHEGEAMLADFGIALAVKEAGGNRLTETGISLGTPQYMSPEQATGDRQLDPRSDVYSLGAVLYEMLTGEPPHSGATVQAVIAKLMTERPTRLRVIREAVPVAVEAAVERALAKTPADRFASAAELVAALEQPEPEIKRPRLRVLPRVALALLLLVGIAGTAWYLLRPRAAAVPITQRQLTYSGHADQPAISPDGKRVAYVISNRTLVVQPLDGGEPVTLVPPVRFILTPRWTRDGSAILFKMFRDTVVNGRIKLAGTWMIPSAGGPAREVLPDIDAFDAGRDTLTALWAQRNPARIETVDLRTGHALKSIAVPDSIGTVNELAWSPDQKWIALAARVVAIVPSEGGRFLSLATGGRSPRWSRSGDALYFLQDTAGTAELRRVDFDPQKGEPRGAPRTLVSLPHAAGFDIGPSGAVVYAQSTGSTQAFSFLVRNRRIVETHALTQGSAEIGTVRISPDGSRVAYSRLEGDRARVEIVPFGGGEPEPGPRAAGHDSGPSWSPDGRALAFVSTGETGTARMMVARVPGGTAQPVGTASPITPASWSADGAWIAYNTDNPRKIALVNLTSQTQSFVTIPDSLGLEYQPSVIVPDARHLVVSTIRKWTDWGKLVLAATDGSRWEPLQEPFGESVPIGFDARGWLYLANGRAQFGPVGLQHAELWRIPLSGGAAELVTALPDGVGDCSIARDGAHLACTQFSSQSDLLVVSGLPVGGR